MNDKIDVNFLGCNTNIDKTEAIIVIKKGMYSYNTL